MSRTRLLLIVLTAVGVQLAIGFALVIYFFSPRPHEWTAQEIATLRSFSIGSLPVLPPDPSNDVADDPRVAAFGHRLYFDPAFSANGAVACSTCHNPALMFTDGLSVAQGVGIGVRNTPTIVGTAYSSWFFWDGRKDSQWAQALASLENPVEHGTTRLHCARIIAAGYRADYEMLFGPLPNLTDQRRFPMIAAPVADPAAAAAWLGMTDADRLAVTRVFVNLGKAIAAYERRIMPGPSRFDKFVVDVREGIRSDVASALTSDEIAGLRLFIGRGLCARCHNGPLFTNNDFHATAVPSAAVSPQDIGRSQGAQDVLVDEFNCRGPYSDAKPSDCASLRFMIPSGKELVGAFKTPTLRNVAETAPYMHAGQLATLRAVLDHYNQAPSPVQGHTDLQPLFFSQTELGQLEAFLRSLSGPLAGPPELLMSPDNRRE